MEQNSHGFAYGVLSGAIGSVLAVWALYLLGKALKPLWTRLNAPSPLTMQAKMQIAQYLEYHELAMQRLEHMDANPKDLYLYLFQLALISFVLISGGLFFLFFASYNPGVPLLPALGVVFPSFGLVFSFVAIIEARKMSAKNIDKTRAKLRAAIDDAKSKLGFPLAAMISSTPIEQNDSASDH